MLKHKTAIGIIAMSIVIMIVLFARYCFVQNQLALETNLPNIQVEQISPATSTSTDAIDLSPEAIAEWSTCRNEKYGYEFKYPKGWYVYKMINGKEDRYPEATLICESLNMVISEHATTPSGFIPTVIYISVIPVDIWKKTHNQSNMKYVIKEKILDGVSTEYHYLTGFPSVAIFRNGEVIDFSVRENNVLQQIPNMSMRTDTIGKKILDAILITFKFIP